MKTIAIVPDWVALDWYKHEVERDLEFERKVKIKGGEKIWLRYQKK